LLKNSENCSEGHAANKQIVEERESSLTDGTKRMRAYKEWIAVPLMTGNETIIT
jgi:hypothetical protein